MKKNRKRFISPGAWFVMEYPGDWFEFEESETTFLFYNPDRWNGNFRISAFKANRSSSGGTTYGVDSVREELADNASATAVRVGSWQCAYSKETFQEGGEWYTTHFWVTGVANISFQCTFTLPRGGDKTPAEEIIESLVYRDPAKTYPTELIPIRILEIGLVNSAYDRMSAAVKKQLKKDFTGSRADLERMQQLINKGTIQTDKQETWQMIGLAFGVVLTNEIEGMEWWTLIDAQREEPVLRFGTSNLVFSLAEMLWKKAKKGETIDLAGEFDAVEKQVLKIEE